MLSDLNTKAANTEISLRNHHQRFNLVQNNLSFVSDLLKRDPLYKMHIGMLDHHPKSIFHMTKTHEWLDNQNAIWLFVPPYHNVTPTMNSSEEASQ